MIKGQQRTVNNYFGERTDYELGETTDFPENKAAISLAMSHDNTIILTHYRPQMPFGKRKKYFKGSF